MLDTKLKPAYILSIFIAVLTLVASAGGLFISNLYPVDPHINSSQNNSMVAN
jgi:hypothetical protein